MISVNDRIEKLHAIIKDINIKATEICKSKETLKEKRKNLMIQKINIVNCAFFDEKNHFTFLLKCINENSNKEISNLYNMFQEEYINIFNNAFVQKDYSNEKLNEIFFKISKKYYDIGIELIK